jgi:hypothetical protein
VIGRTQFNRERKHRLALDGLAKRGGRADQLLTSSAAPATPRRFQSNAARPETEAQCAIACAARARAMILPTSNTRTYYVMSNNIVAARSPESPKDPSEGCHAKAMCQVPEMTETEATKKRRRGKARTP